MRDVKSLSREQLEQVVQSTIDALYLDLVDGSDCYSPDKEWDSGTCALIAETLASFDLTPSR